MRKNEAIYIMTNNTHTNFYIGTTKKFLTRINQHIYKENLEDNIIRHNMTKLVYLNYLESVKEVVKEKNRIIDLSREEKVKLIESVNPGWNDLSKSF